jgi:hypothetical protein
VIVDEFHVVGVSAPPCKTNPELVVATDAVLVFPVILACFQPEAGQFQIPERGGRVQEFQSNPSRLFEALNFPAELPIQQELPIVLAARADHTISILRYAYNEGSHDCRERTEKIAGGDAGSYLTEGGKARRNPHPPPAQINVDPGNIHQCRNKRGSYPASCGYVDFVAWAERCWLMRSHIIHDFPCRLL